VRDRALAELDYAAAEVERYRRLAADEVVSRDALDAAERGHRTAREAFQATRFAVETATHELERARAMLMVGDGSAEDGASDDPIVLRSPIDGVVLSRRRESESVVPAGEPLLEVADVANLEIVSDLLSTDAVQVRRGQPVMIERWGGGDTLHGTVHRVEPSGFTKISALGVEEQRVNVVVDFTDPLRARESLGDAYRVELRIVVWEREDVLKVPTSALFRRGDDWAVFTVEDGQARERIVDVGRRNGLAAEVLSGLEAGEEVIVHPSDAITDGVSVEERST
jgi:HlyD family secretion protein